LSTKTSLTTKTECLPVPVPKNEAVSKAVTKEQAASTTTFILIDTESADGKHWLSEVYILVVHYESVTDQFTTVEDLHLYGTVNPKRMNRTDAFYIYEHVTGLSFENLNHYGTPYASIKHQVHKLISKYPEAILLAREPKLDRHLLGLPHIEEVLDYLQFPYSELYYARKDRPPEITEHCEQFLCNMHEEVSVGQPHCAKVDVLIMLSWLSTVGIMRPTPHSHASSDSNKKQSS